MKKSTVRKTIVAAVAAAMTLSLHALALNQPYWDNVQTQEDIASIYRFTLEGQEYTLPCEISDFRQNGWEFARNEDMTEEISGMTIQNMYFIKDGNPDKAVILNLINADGSTKEAQDCRVTGLELRERYKDNVSFATADGISMTSTKEEVQKVYGTLEDDRTTYDFSTQIREQPDGQFSNMTSKSADSDTLSFYFNDDGSLFSIEMDYYKTFATDQTPGSTERPAYLDTYVAPTTLDADWTKGQIQIDSKVYQLPVPSSELLADGWTFDDGDQSLAGKNEKGLVYMTKGDNKIEVRLANADKNAVLYSNAYVKEITCRTVSAENLSVTVPGNFTYNTTEEQFLAAFPEFEKVTMTSEESGSYQDGNKLFEVYRPKDTTYGGNVYGLSAEARVGYEFYFNSSTAKPMNIIIVKCEDWEP